MTLPALSGAIAWPAPTTGLRLGPEASKPAAITVTRTSSPSESSITVPKMMLASGCAASCTSEAASLISNSPRSLPPAIDISTPCAPSIDASSSGELIAISAALSARPSPRAEPMPISAVPAPDMMPLTSAKSTLIRPGVVIRSVMPCTPLSSTSSALRNASISDTAASPICSSRSLGITISVSQLSRSDGDARSRPGCCGACPRTRTAASPRRPSARRACARWSRRRARRRCRCHRPRLR